MRKVTERLKILLALSDEVGEARADGDAQAIRNMAIIISRRLRNLIVAESVAAEKRRPKAAAGVAP